MPTFRMTKTPLKKDAQSLSSTQVTNASSEASGKIKNSFCEKQRKPI